MYKWFNTAQICISEIQEIQIYGQWGMADLLKEAVIFIDSHKCPEASFKNFWLLRHGHHILTCGKDTDVERQQNQLPYILLRFHCTWTSTDQNCLFDFTMFHCIRCSTWLKMSTRVKVTALPLTSQAVVSCCLLLWASPAKYCSISLLLLFSARRAGECT